MNEVSERTLAWVQRVEEELPLPTCLFPCVLEFTLSSPVEQASVVGFLPHLEWCSKPVIFCLGECRCSHELKCVAKTEEQKEEVVIECFSTGGQVHGVALPFPPPFPPPLSYEKQFSCVWSQKTHNFIKQKEDFLCTVPEFGKCFDQDEGRLFAYVDYSQRFVENNYIVKQGMFIRISLRQKDRDSEYQVHELENGMQRVYNCLVSDDGENYQADVDKHNIYISVCMQVYIFERGTGKFLRKWRSHDNTAASSNCWQSDSRNKIAVSSEMDALFAITPEGVVEFSKEGVQRQLILKTDICSRTLSENQSTCVTFYCYQGQV